ncbi:MAG: class I SAM-dependent methyltransferase, partial [Gaiellaceae bacterium]
MSDPALTPNAWLRWDVVRRLLDGLADVERVLEVGAGEGALGARLARRYDYVGVEPDPRSRARARERVGTVVEALPGETFDLICAFEVLEHVGDDGAELRLWRDRLRSGGWLLLSVPAHEQRFGPADRRVGHFRRYDSERLAVLLTETGFENPRLVTYGFPLGYALEAGRHVLARRGEGEGTAGSGRWLQPSDRLGWATRLGTAPFRLLQRPFARTRLGTGIVAHARRAA